MKLLRKIGLSALILSASFGMAIAGQYGQASLVTGPQDSSQINATINGVVVQMNALAPGLLFSQPTAVATGTGTTEQILGSYNLPANYLVGAGQAIRIKATFKYAANINSKTPKLYFGGSSITGAANTTSGATAMLTCDIVKSGASTQNVACSGLDATTNLATAFTAGTDADTAAILIKASCTDGASSASDCTLQTMTVESLR